MLKNNMFGKSLKFNDNVLGELTFSNGLWNAQPISKSHGEIFVSIEGDKSGPNEISIKQAKELFDNIPNYIEESKKYIEARDITDFTGGKGTLLFDGFHSRNDAGLFDFDFGLSDWDDASITVHFREFKPYDISLGD